MIVNSNTVGIIADDLTGANDTALQFMLNNADTHILLNTEEEPGKSNTSQVWAIATESRNIAPEYAFEKVKLATQYLVEKVNPDYFYKKIDSTIRGNIAVEIMSMLDVLNWDAALIMPAFPQENRITVGGYHLLKGVPIERTEMARDPLSPIFESHLPTLLQNQLGSNLKDIVGLIELKTILDGAGPILQAINKLIEKGVKIIPIKYGTPPQRRSSYYRKFFYASYARNSRQIFIATSQARCIAVITLPTSLQSPTFLPLPASGLAT